MNENTMGEMPKRGKESAGWLANWFSQTAWHLQDGGGRNKRLIFAVNEESAIRKSRLLKWVSLEELEVKRAPYADGLKNDVYKLRDAMRANGWNV